MTKNLIGRLTPWVILLGEIVIGIISANGYSLITGIIWGQIFIITGILALSRYFGILVLGNYWSKFKRSSVAKGISGVVIVYCLLSIFSESFGVYTLLRAKFSALPGRSEAVLQEIKIIEERETRLTNNLVDITQLADNEYLQDQTRKDNKEIQEQLNALSLQKQDLILVYNRASGYGFLEILNGNTLFWWLVGAFSVIFTSVFTALNILYVYFGLGEMSIGEKRKHNRINRKQKIIQLYGK